MSTKRAILAMGLGLVFILGSFTQTIASIPGENTVKRKIVVFRDSAQGQDQKDQAIKQAGAKKVKDLSIINASVLLVNATSEKALAKYADVLRIEDDTEAYTQARPGSGVITPAPEVLPWGIDRIDADRVWDLAEPKLEIDPGTNAGSGVKVAVIDTGINLTHPDLSINIKGGFNAIAPTSSYTDDNGHGTHVAGIIAGADNGVGVLGVAPKAELYAVKVLNKRGSGYISDIIEGIQWSITNNMQVINMSLGSSSDVQSLHDAVLAAYQKGIVIVVAAGNSGPGANTVMYPAKYPEVIAVAATGSNDVVASFSSRGPEVDISAPGVGIYSTYKDGIYKSLSGTSMAAPHVAGTAALVIASGYTGDVRARLCSTAEPLTGLASDYGSGMVDAEKAAALSITP